MRPDAANHDFRAVAIPGPRQFAGPCRRATVLGAMLDLCVSSPCLRRLLVPRPFIRTRGSQDPPPSVVLVHTYKEQREA